eukprot:UN12150
MSFHFLFYYIKVLQIMNLFKIKSYFPIRIHMYHHFHLTYIYVDFCPYNHNINFMICHQQL